MHRGGLTILLIAFIAAVVTGHIGHRHLAGVGVNDPPAPAGSIQHGHAHEAEPHAHAHHSHATGHHEQGHHGHEHGHDQTQPASADGERIAPAHDHAEHAHAEWDWIRVTLLILGLIGLGIVATVPDHFLDEHLWRHLVCIHLWRIFLWTFAALLVTHFLIEQLDVRELIMEHRLPILLLACLIGIIPASGPHLIFVTLYAQGSIPFSTFLASCIVQDGHGMIPMLAHSRRAFAGVKAINFAIGLGVGILGWLLSW